MILRGNYSQIRRHMNEKAFKRSRLIKYLLRGRDRKNKVRYLQIQKTKSWMSQYTSPLIMEIAKMMQNVHIATRSFLLTKGEKNGSYALNVEFGAMKSVLGMMITKIALCYCLEG